MPWQICKAFVLCCLIHSDRRFAFAGNGNLWFYLFLTHTNIRYCIKDHFASDNYGGIMCCSSFLRKCFVCRGHKSILLETWNIWLSVKFILITFRHTNCPHYSERIRQHFVRSKNEVAPDAIYSINVCVANCNSEKCAYSRHRRPSVNSVHSILSPLINSPRKSLVQPNSKLHRVSLFPPIPSSISPYLFFLSSTIHILNRSSHRMSFISLFSIPLKLHR